MSTATDRTISVLRSIVMDGEISADEAYALAEFFNSDSEAADEWPGNVLVPLLAAFWEDGAIEEDELHGLLTAIQTIERQMAADSGSEPESEAEPNREMTVTQTAAKKEPLKTLNLAVDLPSIPVRIKVVSKSEANVRYDVDLNVHTCTCQDWLDQRQRYPVGDLRRTCKHVATAFTRNGDFTSRNPLIAALMYCYTDIGRGFPTDGKLYLAESTPLPLAVVSTPREWVDIFVPSVHGKYTRFGFSKEEGRWAYGSRPQRSRMITEWVYRVAR